jgi:hypothetical protein
MITLADDTSEQKTAEDDRQRRRSEDFRFMVLCASKNNMAMYQLLRDRTLDDEPKE